MRRLWPLLLLFVFVLGGTAFWVQAQEDAEWLLDMGELYGGVASYEKENADCWYVDEHSVYVCPIPVPNPLPVANPTARTRAVERLMEVGLLLIVDNTNMRVMAFDPITGDLLDENFIPPDPDNLDLPYNAIYYEGGESIIVNSYGDDLIQEYDLAGNYLGWFAPIAGVNTDILDTPRGLAWLDETKFVVASVLNSPVRDVVVEFEINGIYLGDLVTDGLGGLDSPYDVYVRENDLLVSGAVSDAVHRYDLDGMYLGDFAAIDGFPSQIAEAANGNILVANQNGLQQGVVELDPMGNLVAVYDVLDDRVRGVYELPNGNLLVTSGTAVVGEGRVSEIDRAGVVVDTKLMDSMVTPRHIEFMSVSPSLAMTMTVGLTPAGCATTDTLTLTEPTDITYCYQVTNTGDLTLQTHDLEDSELGTLLDDFAFPLAPGETTLMTTTTTISATVTSTGIWTATTALDTTVSGTDTVTVTYDPPPDPDPIELYLPIISSMSSSTMPQVTTEP